MAGTHYYIVMDNAGGYCHCVLYSASSMRLRSILERHPGAGIMWTGVTGKVHISDNEYS